MSFGEVKLEKVKLPLDYDPYEEDCCGSYGGDTMTIETQPKYDGLTIRIQERPSGIGPEYVITAKWKDQTTHKTIVYVSDDGELVMTAVMKRGTL